MKDMKWRLILDNNGIYLWVASILPLSIAESVVGRQLNEVVEFSHPDVAINEAAVIEEADSEPTGTTFKLLLPSSRGLVQSSYHYLFPAGGTKW